MPNIAIVLKDEIRRLGLSAEDFGKLVGVTPLTIYHWEHGKSRPRPPQFARLVAVRGIGKREAQRRLEAIEAEAIEAEAMKAKSRKRKPR